MKYYILPKYQRLLPHSKTAQDTLTHFLTTRGDFDYPTFLHEYPTCETTQLPLFRDYEIIQPYTAPAQRLVFTHTLRAREFRSELEVAVSRLSLPVAPCKSYRVKKMLGEV